MAQDSDPLAGVREAIAALKDEPEAAKYPSIRGFFEDALTDPTMGETAASYGKQFVKGAVAQPLSGMAGTAGQLAGAVGLEGAKETLLGAQESVEEYSRENLAPDWRVARESMLGEFGGDLAQGFGSAAGFIASAAVGGPILKGLGMGARAAQMVSAGGLGATLKFDEMFREAQAYGATEREAWQAGFAGAGIGAGEAFGVGSLLARVNRRSGGLLKSMVTSIWTEGTEEAIQEGLWEAPLSNLVRKHIIGDEEQAIFEGALEQGLIGFIVGGTLGAGFQAGAGAKAAVAGEPFIAEPTHAERKEFQRVQGQAKNVLGGVLGAEPSVGPVERTEAEVDSEGADPLESYRAALRASVGPLTAARDAEAAQKGLKPAEGLDITPEGRVVAPATPEEQAIAGFVGDRGMGVTFVEAGHNGIPAMYSGGHLIWNTDSAPGLAAEAVLLHETAHHLQAAFGEDWAKSWAQVQKLDPKGTEWAAREYARRSAEQGRPVEGTEAQEEGEAFYIEQMAGWLRYVGENPDVAALAEQAEPGFLGKIRDAVVAVLNRLAKAVGLKGQLKTTIEKQQARVRDIAEAVSPEALKGLDFAAVVEIADTLLGALDLSLGTSPREEAAREAAPAPEGEAVQEKPAREGERPSEAVPPKEGKKKTPMTPGDAKEQRRQTPGQRRRARKKAGRLEARARKLVGRSQDPDQHLADLEESRRLMAEADDIRAGLDALERLEISQAARKKEPRAARTRRQETPETAAEKATREWEEGRDRFALPPDMDREAVHLTERLAKIRAEIKQLDRDFKKPRPKFTPKAEWSGYRRGVRERQRELRQEAADVRASRAQIPEYLAWRKAQGAARAERERLAFERERRRDAEEEAAAEAHAELVRTVRPKVFAKLRKAGLKREHAGGGSYYYAHPTVFQFGRPFTVRVSDHAVPLTAEREYMADTGGWSWATHGHQIVISPESTPDSVMSDTGEALAALHSAMEGRDRFALAPRYGTEGYKRMVAQMDPRLVDGDTARTLYHGTKQVFTQFSPTRYDNGLSFFAFSPEFAAEWITRDTADHRRIGRVDDDFDKGPQLEQLPGETKEQAGKRWMAERLRWREEDVTPERQDVSIMPVHVAASRLFDPEKNFGEIEDFLHTVPGMSGAVDAGMHKYGNWIIYEQTPVVREIARLGYDGMLLSESVTDPERGTVAVWDSSLAKSATGNTGAFDLTKPDIRRALVGAPYFEDWRTPDDTRLEKFARTFVNRLDAIKKLGEEATFKGMTLSDAEDPYQWAMLRQGRTKYRLDKLEEEYIKPITALVAKHGLMSLKDPETGLDLLSEWLIARTAEDKNRVVSERSKGENFAGSGMGTETARAILATVAEHELAPQFEAVGDLFDRMNSEKMDAMVADQLITAEHRDRLREMYPHYAPTKSMEDAEMEDWMGTIGRGYRAQGKEFQTMFGRETPASDPLAFAMTAASAAIIRGEKNKVGVALAKLLREGDQDWARGVAQFNLPMRKKVLGKDGLERTVPDFSYKNQPNVYVFKDAGVEKVLTFNARYIALADAMNTMNAADLDGLTRVVSSISRTWAALRTRWNIAFGPFNFMKDIGLGATFAAVEHGPKAGKDVFAGIPAAVKALALSKGKYAHHLDPYKRSGGPISVYGLETAQDVKKKLDKAINSIGKTGAPHRLRKLGRGMIEWVENANDLLENATRFSAYVMAREQLGMTEAQAALYAKDFTVNFEQKGRVGTHFNAFYPFWNAGVQSLDKMYRVAKENPAGFAKMSAAAVSLGAMLEILNTAISDDDEDGESFYKKMPEHVKDRNYVMMFPDGDAVLVPMPFILNSFMSFGRNIAAAGVGNKGVAEAAGDSVMSFADSASPFGGPTPFLQFALPSLVDPFVQHLTNEDWKGDPLRKDNLPWGVQKPDSELYFKRVNPHFQAFTAWANRFTGGDRVEPGAISVNPHTLEHMWDTLSGSAGATVQRAFGTAGRATKGEFEVRSTPLVRRLVYEPSPYESLGRVREALDDISQAKARVKAAQEDKRFDDARRYRKEYRGLLRMEESGKALKKRLATLGERIDAAEGEKKQQLEDQRQKVAKRWLKRVKEARE